MAEEPLDVNAEEEEEELFEHHRVVVDKGQSPLRVDKFLLDRLEGTSRNRIQNAIGAGFVRVNEAPIKANYKVRPEDQIVLAFPKPPRDKELLPENIPLEIVFEDEHLLVVNKPAGLVVHPGFANWEGTLVNGLIYHFQNLPSAVDGAPRPGLVHRIDKDTSGLLVVAKNEEALTFLARQFFHKTAKRTYTALVWGHPDPAEGTYAGNIGRSLRDRRIMQVFGDENVGKNAVTHYSTLEPLTYVTLVECRLETGRTHQIRVHFQHNGHPLFGDPMYGGNVAVKGPAFTKYKQFVDNTVKLLAGQALHARTLGFVHPVTKQELFFEAPLPPAFEQVLEKWRRFAPNHGEQEEEEA